MLFSFFRKNKKNIRQENIDKNKKIGGDIGYHKLEEWWMNEFTEEEREIVRETYKPFGESEDFVIDEGEILKTSASRVHFLCFAIGGYTSYEKFNIGKKFLEKAESLIEEENDIINVHFVYHYGIELYYSNRDKINGALDGAIEYCKKQISISEEVKKAYLSKDKFLPTHRGFKQLAIIYEKQGEIEKAIEVTNLALEQGWNEDSERRLQRLEKKLLKNK